MFFLNLSCKLQLGLNAEIENLWSEQKHFEDEKFQKKDIEGCTTRLICVMAHMDE